ncbi:MAG TPA: AsmA family protein [Kaistiaceae bacterium]|nr:AsmA family protein [Kaistiaceae bacterium]
MRRVIIGLSTAAIAVAAVVAITPVLISSDTVKTQIAAQISDWTGAPVTLTGEPVVTLFPDLTVKLKGVTVAGAGGADAPPLVAMDVLRGSLRLLPLLGGRFEISEFRMTRPRLHLEVDASGAGNWQLLDGSVARGLATGNGDPAGNLRLGTFVLADGIVTFDDHRTGRHEEATNIDLEVDWPTLDSRGSASGTLVWRGEVVETNISASAPLAFFSGESSDLRLGLASPPLRVAFSGTANRRADLQLEGDLDVSSPSVRRLLEWTGRPVGPGATFGPLSVSSAVNMVGPSASLADATIELDGNKAEGVLAIKLGEKRPSLQGTLALDTLDLSAYGGLLAAEPPAAGQTWRDAAIPAAALDALDLDLRVSAGRVLLGKAKLGRTALSAMMRDQRLALEVGEAVLYGGRGDGSVVLEASAAGVQGRASGSLSGVKLGALLPDLFAHPGIEGDARVSASLQGRGATYHALLRSLSGTAEATIAPGAILGTDIVSLVTAALGQPLPKGAEAGSRTAFETAEAKVTIAGGVAEIDSLSVTSPILGLSLTGSTDLAGEAFDLAGTATVYERPETADTAHGPTVAELPFAVVGGWSSPLVLPSLGKLLR